MKKQLIDLFHGPFTAWVILSVSLFITVVAWYLSNEFAEQKAEEHFKLEINEAQSAIEKRFSNYEQVLRSGLSLMRSSPSVDRQTWEKFITNLDIDKNYPGTLGIGYALWLTPEQRLAHINAVRAEGFPNFNITPAGERDIYTSIIYLEPFNTRNQRAFGFDMFSEPTRREAMTRAIENGETALSGKVTLVQESSSDVQPGFLLYLPHYREDSSTIAERQNNLVGFVYSALRVGDLMNGILSSGASAARLDFEIYDGETITSDTLLYDSNNHLTLGRATDDYQFNITQKLVVGGHIWNIHYNSNTQFDLATETAQPTLVAAGGIIIDLLLFYIISTLMRLRKQANQLADSRQHQLTSINARFKTISDTAYDGIVLIDDRGKITYANRSAGEITQTPPEQLCGVEFFALFPESSHEKIQQIFQEQLSELATTSHMATPVEITALRANRQNFPMELIVGHWRHENTIGLTAAFRDITERHKLDKATSEFISTVSHELRTPLTSIFGSLSLINSGQLGEVNPQIKSLVEIGFNNCERLTRLINDILDFEKMGQGELAFTIVEHNALELLRQAISPLKAMSEKQNICINILGNEDISIAVDKDRFDQIITNLVGNAIKFAPSQTTIDIQLSHAQERTTISVTDYGPGIPLDFREQIFNRFSQADASDTRKHDGSGLGLSIAKAMTEAMHGHIDFTSELDKQTTFTVTFPSSLPTQTEITANA